MIFSSTSTAQSKLTLPQQTVRKWPPSSPFPSDTAPSPTIRMYEIAVRKPGTRILIQFVPRDHLSFSGVLTILADLETLVPGIEKRPSSILVMGDSHLSRVTDFLTRTRTKPQITGTTPKRSPSHLPASVSEPPTTASATENHPTPNPTASASRIRQNAN